MWNLRIGKAKIKVLPYLYFAIFVAIFKISKEVYAADTDGRPQAAVSQDQA